LRIEAVKAHAFGPFAGSTLELAPRMNVIYGPNESGKSSWHAAIYAGLCGLKRSRGRLTREDQAFTSRHRPWRGTSWRIGLAIVLDDGRTIDIDQGLGQGGGSSATDRSTGRPITAQIVRDGSVDGAMLLGLTRETAVATLFVRQADVLRVLTDASELQEYLERAAATSAVDTTADEALAQIAGYRRDHVGLLRSGSRGPLAAASGQLSEARSALDAAELHYEECQDLLSRKHAAELELRNTEAKLGQVLHHEQWRRIRTSEGRVDQARQLMRAAGDGSANAAPRDLMTSVTGAVATFESRPAEQEELEGPDSHELEQQLAATPAWPAGDLEPAAGVMSSYDAWQREVQRLAAHDEIRPPDTAGDQLPVAPVELRRLADELEAQDPPVDASLAQEIAGLQLAMPAPANDPGRAGVAPTAITPSVIPRIIAFAGVCLAATGVVLAAVGQRVVGAASVIGGIALVGVGVALSTRGARRRSTQAPAPYPLTPNVELIRLEARLVLQEEALAQASRRRALAAARVEELGLPADPDAIRRLAAEKDTISSLLARFGDWQRRKDELTETWSTRAELLRSTLDARGEKIGPETRLDQAVQNYIEGCRQRSQVAQKAARKPDLLARLTSRRAAETAWEQDRAARAQAEVRLIEVGKKAGCNAANINLLADELRRWVKTQEILDEAGQIRGQAAARLDQFLDGRTIEELEAEIIELTAKAGEAPVEEPALLADRSAEAETLDGRIDELRDTAAELTGQLASAESQLLDVSEAIEADARADTEVRRLTCLAEDLDEVIDILTAAQRKVHADIAPVLNEAIRPWVPRVTQGRYDDLHVNPATLELEAHETSGQFRPATVLSQGTTEQLFLLLRLALAQHLATTGESAPIILDDVTVQSDAARTMGILDLLHELSAAHQVVLFSQEDEVLRWAEEKLTPPSDNLVRLVPQGH